jgi:hypothetical protein
MPEFWINAEGQNMLKGVEGDFDNPLMLPDDYIVAFLLHIPNARASFDRLFPALLPEEQTRLDPLRNTAASGMFLDEVEASDRLQALVNTVGVRRGGGWAPPPWREPGT